MARLGFATALTLIVVPTLYGVFFGVKVPKAQLPSSTNARARRHSG